MSAIRKYYLISVNKNGIAREINVPLKRPASVGYWEKYQKPLIKKGDPEARVYTTKSKKDKTLVDYVTVSYPDGSKDYIVAHTKYQEMLKKNKFNFGR